MILADNVIDLDSDAALHRDVRLIGGEARVRHIYLDRPEALDDVRDRWTETLAAHARVADRQQALDEHWFGPTPPAELVTRRIGDLIAVARDRAIMVRPGGEPLESTLLGHHGAWTADEQRVPLIATAGSVTVDTIAR